MNQKDRFGDKLRALERGRENQYFARQDRELIAKLHTREQAKAKQLRRELARLRSPRWQRMVAIKQILVPIDFSVSSLRALLYAATLAKPLKAKIIIVSVLEPVRFATPGYFYHPTGTMPEVFDEQRLITGQELETLREDLRKRRIDTEVMLEEGTPHQVIVDVARERKVDLIVMSTHGRTGLPELIIGSVAEKVLRTATCPVLMLRGYGSGTRPTSGRGARQKPRRRTTRKRR